MNMANNTSFGDLLNSVNVGDELNNTTIDLHEFLFGSHSPINTDVSALEHRNNAEMHADNIKLNSTLESNESSADFTSSQDALSSSSQTPVGGMVYDLASLDCKIQSTFVNNQYHLSNKFFKMLWLSLILFDNLL